MLAIVAEFEMLVFHTVGRTGRVLMDGVKSEFCISSCFSCKTRLYRSHNRCVRMENINFDIINYIFIGAI